MNGRAGGKHSYRFFNNAINEIIGVSDQRQCYTESSMMSPLLSLMGGTRPTNTNSFGAVSVGIRVRMWSPAWCFAEAWYAGREGLSCCIKAAWDGDICKLGSALVQIGGVGAGHCCCVPGFRIGCSQQKARRVRGVRREVINSLLCQM